MAGKTKKIYRGTFDDSDSTTGVSAISLVDVPAISVSESWKPFVTMSAQNPDPTSTVLDVAFKASSESDSPEKRIAYGPIMIPDLLIFRKFSEPIGECEMYFDADTIELIAQKFFREQSASSTNLNHDGTNLDGVWVTESWFITDPENDKSAALGFTGLPARTWFGAVKINDDAVWEDVKAGKYTGFSIEGLFGLAKISLSESISNSNMATTKKSTKVVVNAVDATKVPAEMAQYIIQTQDTNGTPFQVNIDSTEIRMVNQAVTPHTLDVPADGRYTFPERGCSATVMAGKITELIFESIWMFRTDQSDDAAADPQAVFFGKFESTEQSKWLKLSDKIGGCVACAAKSQEVKMGIALATLLNAKLAEIFPNGT